MYKKAVGGLILLYLVFFFSFLCVKGIASNRQGAQPVSQMKMDERMMAKREGGSLGIVEVAVSGQRVVDVQALEKTAEGRGHALGQEDKDILLRIVEAEAGNQDEDGKLLVANVVLNRVDSEKFPDTVTKVVFQDELGVYQFSPVSNGRIWSVEVSEETKEAVERALAGDDISDGALYFAARQYADGAMMKWFDENLTYLFAYGGHEFFK